MTTSKVSVSLDPAVTARAREDVAAGKATSVSDWLNQAARSRVERDDLSGVLAEIFEASGGPLTEHELVDARARLADTERR